jgi:hypothetical protein
MARNPRKPAKTSRKPNGINPATGLPWRFRAPREMRVVSALKVRSKKRNESAKRPKPRTVPQIRLSGAWLERVGFARGTRFLVLADVRDQILLTLLDPSVA